MNFKTLITSLVALLATSTVAIAQLTISNCEAFPIGTVLKFQQCSTNNMNPGASGPGVSWDFSGLIKTADTTTEWIVDPATTTLGTFFPNANMCEKYSDGTFVYAHTNTDSSLLVGFGDTINQYLINYYNPLLFALRPSVYGSVISDSFITHFSSSNYTYDGKGLARLNADSYGTLILPNGTYNNTLRLKITESEVDTTSSTTAFVTTVSYIWFDGIHTSALLKIDSTGNSGTTVSKSIQYLINETTEVPALNKTLQFSFYPNPAKDLIHIAPCATGTVSLINTLGQILTTINVGERGTTIPIQPYTPGLYYLSYKTNAGTKTYQVSLLQ